MPEETTPPAPNLISADTIASQLVGVSKVHVNVEQEFIVTTEDKVRLCLTNHLEAVERRREWIAPLGVFPTLIVALLTTSFRDWYLSKDTWLAVFIIATVLSVVWLVRSMRYVLQSRHSLDAVIREIKAEAVGSKTVASSVEVSEARSVTTRRATN